MPPDAAGYEWKTEMPKVIIDGIEYIPKAEIPPLTDERLKQCLAVLTSMRYFGENHKMKAHAWEAIKSLSPELAALSESAAYKRIHGEEDV